MRYIKSCGFVAYRPTENGNCYLIIKSPNGDVGFPKGHVELGESELQTAQRELMEETGIEVEALAGFRYTVEYPLPRIPDAIKQVVYFVGKCRTEKIVCQEGEVVEAGFLSYKDALEALTFDATKKILREAEIFINSTK